MEFTMFTSIDFAKLDLMDALDLAMLIEAEAYKRYHQFASQLGGSEPGYFFLRMAENEEKHGKEISEKRKSLFGDIPKNVDITDIFDVEAPEFGAIRGTMSVLQAFELGMTAEKKAYDFYNEALEFITDEEVKELFTELRDEETEHYDALKRMRDSLPPSASIEGELNHDETPYL
ncbi:MAG: rubrerythrin [Acidobacteria bacterium]|nr:MAG: rubrerythrin [Acidobacteriota bacterium]